MPRFRRHRSSSAGSYQEGSSTGGAPTTTSTSTSTPATTANSEAAPTAEDWGTAKEILHSLLYMKDAHGKGFLHSAFQGEAGDDHNSNNNTDLHMAKCLLDRCRALDDREEALRIESNNNNTNNYGSSKVKTTSWQDRFLLQPTLESGYTPLHAAIVAGDLAAILLYLKYPSAPSATNKPMMALQAISTEGSRVVDAEGLTPLELLGKLQISRLRRCRASLQQLTAKLRAQSQGQQQYHGRSGQLRSASFDFQQHEDDELDVLRENMHLLGEIRDGTGVTPPSSGPRPEAKEEFTHAFEVVTFGRPHHCALGVISSGGSNLHEEKKSSNKDSNPAVAAATFRPQRVQEFAQERVLREGSAVAVAAAAHHTMVACRDGQLYVFGLNKGGRLGLGDNCPQQCPLPRRILALKRKHVVAIAAAENHSLCVTSDGMVWAWGNNQFGQLGDSLGNNSSSSGATSSRSVPKPVEELKKVTCVAVAAGERHSVALSGRGEVYVWGNNTSGQLGVARRSGIQKVQRVEALWNSGSSSYQQQRKIAVAIAAADQSTLVLIAPVAGLAQVNSVYWWGHGNHVPMRVQFDNNNNQSSMSTLDSPGAMTKSQRLINPVAIACAKYHNAAVTSDGCVYTWGTSSESLGRGAGSKVSPGARSTSGSHRATASPQLVTGMLPENGGGFAVSVSASEQHTAVVTDTGALFTWGVAHGKNVMGHEGVRWQPSPKRVPGVQRAVNVAVAKEHTVVLIGTTFPPIPPSQGLCSLESLSAHTIARYVDLFNVIPILIMAEQNQCKFLIEFCTEFVRQNLDGVLNVGKKGVMEQYLNNMLAQNLYHSGRKFRDDHHHPFITDVITAGNKGKPTFHREWLSTTEEWVQGCKQISQSSVARQILAFAASREQEDELAVAAKGRKRRASSSANEYDGSTGRARATSYGSEQDGASKERPPSEGVLDAIINKTATMDLSTKELADKNSCWLGKEIRGVRKKLNQIEKLRESEAKSIVLTIAEQAKVERRPVLEAELHVYETALEEVKKRIQELILEDQKQYTTAGERLAEKNVPKAQGPEMKLETMVEEGEESSNTTYACEICGIRCPDKTSFELHQNGRKHRNRLAQVAEAEQQKAAESIMVQKQLEQVNALTSTPRSSAKTRQKNVWGASCTPPPKFKLPPPPHPVVAQVAPQNNVAFTPKTPPQVPAANFQSILLEQQASQKKNSPQPKSLYTKVAFPIWTGATASPNPNKQAPFHLHAAPDLTGSTSRNGQRNAYSLADFLAPKPQATPTKIATTSAWSSTPTKVVKIATKMAGQSKSLAEIQAEEADLKARQDRLYAAGDNGETSWFIERRERADSLHAIQEAAEKDRETQLMIQEQLAIEAQIKKELAAQREQNKKATSSGDRQTKKNAPNKSNKSPANNKNSPQPKPRENMQGKSNARSGNEKTRRPANKPRQPKRKQAVPEKSPRLDPPSTSES